jgi:outer membrane protein TolC
LSLEDLRGKLTAGVQEAYEASMSGREQIRLASEEVRNARETYRLSDLRLQENAPGNSITEVMQSIRGLDLAHFNHISALREYNKAQLRLSLLLGRAASCKPATLP